MEERNTKKSLAIVLGILCVAIIGLVVGIVVVNTSVVTEEIKDDDEIVNNVLVDILPMDVDEAEIYLDEKLKEYSDSYMQFKLKMMKINVYLNDNRPENAIVAATNIDDNYLDDEQKMDYYTALFKAYRQIGDAENEQFYIDKYLDVYNKVFDGGGGGN